MKTLLVIGDGKDWDSYQKFLKQKRFFKKHDFIFKSTGYDDVLNCRLPKIRTDKLVIFFFFPFNYWEKKIETKVYKGVYGNKSFYIKFIKFWRVITRKINKVYANKKIFYINEPKWISMDRDKELTKRIVSRQNIPVAKSYSSRDLGYILKLLDEGKKLFIKVRYGSMGKGITYLEKGRWFTNFRFRKNKIVSKKSDYGWRFKDITGNKRFLRELLKQDIVIEDALNPLLLKGKKFDMRLYVFFGKVLHIYPRSNDCEEITTNISQGARGENLKFLQGMPPRILEKSIKYAIKATKAPRTATKPEIKFHIKALPLLKPP